MSHQDDLPSIMDRPAYPPGFRPRRGLNWAFLGFLYTSYYLCRYNFPIANTAIGQQFHFNETQLGWIITAQSLAYAVGQWINGLICDRIGGKKSMIIGAIGTIITNVCFGFASFVGQLSLFVLLWGMNGYVQSFGAPGMVKINTAWFHHRERGGFSGIFGFMINLGKFIINRVGPMLLAGFTFMGFLAVPPLHWRWLFFGPSIVIAIVAIFMAIFVKETPEAAGFYHMQPKAEANPATDDPRARPLEVFKKIITHPGIWFTGCAYFCTGGVRAALEQWFPHYMVEVHHLPLNSTTFYVLGFLMPFVASSGSLLSGYISDLYCKSRRAPVAAALYFIEAAVILAAAHFAKTTNETVIFFIAISFTCNSTHSLLGSAAAMDIGGRKMAGFASGVIDSFQYLGQSLSGVVLGYLIVRGNRISPLLGWHYYWYFMVPFGIIGGLLMVFAGHTITVRAEHEPPPVVVVDPAPGG